ncbi:hypothetical protein KEJ50_04135 [Candidatus Bathyarchaeota archaeon]|nr:hypothetical protein [Candidatus Bathyarchaeota archaeon]
MKKCEACGVSVTLPFICNYCGKPYCMLHRLPEAHSCPGLSSAKASIKNIPEVLTQQVKAKRLSLKSPIKLTSELKQLLIAWLVLAFCFSTSALFTPTYFPIKFFISLITLGFGFIIHELTHRYVARAYGCWAEFRLWPLGLFMALIFALISGGRVIFAAPGAVYIIPRYLGFGYGVTKRENGIISLSGPLANILAALIFLPLTKLGGIVEAIGLSGFEINLWLAAFNLLPFGMMDGRKVFSWSPAVWVLITIPTWLLLVLPQLFF